MTMVGLDTNVLIRFLTQDDPVQCRRASAEIEGAADRGATLFVANVVLCELVWVLEDAYGYSRRKIQVVLDSLLRSVQLQFEDKEAAWLAFGDYSDGKADFSDYLVGRIGARAGCAETLTFDKALRDSSLFRVL
jgi:predicted nucleic-acid-binding protein